MGALVGKGLGGGQGHAGASSGDDGHLVFESLHRFAAFLSVRVESVVQMAGMAFSTASISAASMVIEVWGRTMAEQMSALARKRPAAHQ